MISGQDSLLALQAGWCGACRASKAGSPASDSASPSASMTGAAVRHRHQPAPCTTVFPIFAQVYLGCLHFLGVREEEEDTPRLRFALEGRGGGGGWCWWWWYYSKIGHRTSPNSCLFFFAATITTPLPSFFKLLHIYHMYRWHFICSQCWSCVVRGGTDYLSFDRCLSYRKTVIIHCRVFGGDTGFDLRQKVVSSMDGSMLTRTENSTRTFQLMILRS